MERAHVATPKMSQPPDIKNILIEYTEIFRYARGSVRVVVETDSVFKRPPACKCAMRSSPWLKFLIVYLPHRQILEVIFLHEM